MFVLFSALPALSAPEPCGPTGRIVFSSSRGGDWALWSVAPDGTGLAPVPEARDLRLHAPAIHGPSRRIAAVDDEGSVWIIPPGGAPQRLAGTPPDCASPAWSPDGGSLVFACYRFENREEESDLWTAELAAGHVRLLLKQKGIQKYPVWSPDGRTIVYTSGRRVSGTKVVEEIWSVDREGRDPRPILAGDFSNVQPAFSPDGARIAFASDRGGDLELWVADRERRDPVPWTRDSALDADPAWSPDGASMVFVSTRGGRMDLWVVSGAGGEPRRITGLDGIAGESKEPAWGP